MFRLVALIAALFAASPALAQPALSASEPLPLGTDTQRIGLARVTNKMQYGTVYTTIQAGLLCIPARRDKIDGTEFQRTPKQFESVFRSVLQAQGFEVQDDSDDLFDNRQASTRILVSAGVVGFEATVCAPYSGMGQLSLKGRSTMRVDWQIYSSLDRKLLTTISTEGAFRSDKAQDVNITEFAVRAFASNVLNLAGNDEFRRLVAIDRSPNVTQKLDPANTVMLVSSGAPMTIPDAVGSVVAVITGSGWGSGFLVSNDGYLLTNQHVVGDSSMVKIRWSDGFETTGEVIRSHKARDVALIKTEPHGRSPLALRRQLPQPAENVIAIGAPLDEKLQGTITKGVVSANRIQDGFSFIQSDVAVDHGNSGGPLLNENGEVIGITDWGYTPDGVSHNLNFFIPIGDAFDFLALKPQISAINKPAA